MPATEPADRDGSSTSAEPLVRPFEFDTQTRLLCRDGREVALPPRVLGVLELLLRRAGDVVSRQELIDTVWKDAFVTDTSLAEAVSVLEAVAWGRFAVPDLYPDPPQARLPFCGAGLDR